MSDASNSELLFVPLGGTGEIGMNLNLYAYDGEWLMVDCGMMISGDSGEDQVYVPDPAFLRDKTIMALVLTHAHEDHIGGIVDLWEHLNCPIYATPFTAAVVRRKFAESKDKAQPQFKIFPVGSRFEIGPFDVEMIPITHSTVESHSIVLRTPAGAVLHTGDWKLDPQPLIGPKTAEARFKALAQERVLAVVGDSTNAQIPGWSSSEGAVRERMIDLVSPERNRVVCACFSSNIARLATFFEIARATNRHPVLVGRSLLRMVGAAQETGYLPRDLNSVPLHDAMYLPRHKVLFICTGSQGEERAALARISRQEHRDVFFEEGDVVFFSSKVIPGNEEGIAQLQRRFERQGVRVVSEDHEPIHVSGHPCVEELKQMYAWVKPEALIPVHGYPEHLMAHANVGRACSLKHVLEIRNGDIVLLNDGVLINDEGPRVVGETSVGRVMRVEEPWAPSRGRGGRGRGPQHASERGSRWRGERSDAPRASRGRGASRGGKGGGHAQRSSWGDWSGGEWSGERSHRTERTSPKKPKGAHQGRSDDSAQRRGDLISELGGARQRKR